MGSVFQTVGNAVGSTVGGLTGGISQGLTPQNNYNASSPLDTGALQTQLTNAQGGLATNQANQSALASALLAQSQGQGPNVAQQQLNQQTNQNIQQNAGMIASQKGINPALAARLGSENAGNMSQQAAGQGAVLGAQQQVAAQQGLANVYGQQANENLQNAQTSGTLANQSSLGAQQINAGTSAQNAAATQNTNSGLLNGIGAATKLFADGGAVGSNPFGGSDASSNIALGMSKAAGVPSWQTGVTPLQLGGASGTSAFQPTGQLAGGLDADQLISAGTMLAFKGGKIPAHMHPIANIYHPNFQTKQTEVLKSKGGPVPGKAKVSGNSIRNDTQPAMLSPGEIVLPRSVTMAKDPAKEAAKFVAQELKKRGAGKNADAQGDFKDALKKAIGSRRGA